MNAKLNRNRNKQKGITFERRVKKHLQSKGYFVARQGASLFPDLLAVKEGRVFGIECKFSRHMSWNEQLKSMELERNYDIVPVFATRVPKNGHLLFWKIPYKNKIKEVWDGV